MRVAAVHVQQVSPDGPVTDAPTPIPVSFTLQWVLHENQLGPVVSEQGWAVAWTSDAVLVCFRIQRQGMAVWLPARAVTRRPDRGGPNSREPRSPAPEDEAL